MTVQAFIGNKAFDPNEPTRQGGRFPALNDWLERNPGKTPDDYNAWIDSVGGSMGDAGGGIKNRDELQRPEGATMLTGGPSPGGGASPQKGNVRRGIEKQKKFE